MTLKRQISLGLAQEWILQAYPLALPPPRTTYLYEVAAIVVRARADLRTLPLTADKGAMLGEPKYA